MDETPPSDAEPGLTGDEIRDLRDAYEMSGADFAAILGVHHTTLYRWEKTEGEEASIEPLQHALLLLLRKHSGKVPLRRRLVRELSLRSPLAALHALLHVEFYQRKAPKKEANDAA